MVFVRRLPFLLAAVLVVALLQTPPVQAQPDQQLACVTLLQYKHRDCKGSPISVRNVTVWTKPGTPCKHTDSMGDNSVKNEYCSQLDTDAPEFHQKVYVKNKKCKVEWYQKAYSPMQLTYSSNKCTYGYNIQTCTRGACENPTLLNEGEGDQDEEGMIQNVAEEIERDETNWNKRLWKRRIGKALHQFLHDVVGFVF